MAGRTQLAPQGFNWTHIASSATFTILSALTGSTGPLGLFGGILINAAGTSWVVTVYDGSVAQNVVVATFTAALGQLPLNFPLQLNNGLTVVTSGTAGDLTVAWL
jgi:hypothetical protein